MPASQGVVNVDSMNKTQGKHNHSRSTFDDSLSYRNHFTARFGEYTPSFLMEGEPTDRISVNSLDLIDSMSLKAPFKGSIRKIKESFKVPLMAILPQNWDRIYTQPSNGSDVPSDAYCTLEGFTDMFSAWWKKFYDIVTNASAALTASSSLADCEAVVNAVWKTLILGEYVYSNGSLLSVSGYHASSQWLYTKPLSGAGALADAAYNGASYDQWFDVVMAYVFGRVREFTLTIPVGSGSENFLVRGPSSSGEAGSSSGSFYNNFRWFIEKVRECPNARIHDFVLRNDTTLAEYIQHLQTLSGNTSNGYFEADKIFFFLPTDSGMSSEDFTDRSSKNLDLSRLLAYQLVCAHYYSNSSIDFVYSAELYRQYIFALYSNRNTNPGNTTMPRFSWNGMLCTYDYLSEYVLARGLWLSTNATDYHDPNNLVSVTLSYLTDPSDSNYTKVNGRLAFMAAIFGFRKSLRFGDYFVGARPRPLAPINTDVSVNNNAVSVIDVTRNIQAQKFGNAVMRSRQKIEEYVASLFGGSQPAPDFHNPFFLSRETETIFGEEVQNTGAAQNAQANSRTANFASRAGRFTFTFDNSDKHKCIYLQIISFDIKRAYTRSVDRQFLVLDRYDMFNPDFQYIGDQPIYGIELGYNYGSFIPRVFGYTSRDMEYKQRFDVASGGFVEQLPGWILTDRNREHYQPAKLSPDFIRSFSCELDQFYLSLTGYSLGSYFHFAIITNNNVSASRPMAVDPQILE